MISCRKTSCSAHFGGWDQTKALLAGMLQHIPPLTLHKVSDNHTPLRAAWENPCGEPGLSHPISFSSLIYPTASTPFLQVTPSFASKALLESNLIFQHSNLQNSKRGGAGGAEDWLAFSYVMDEHTP